MTNRDNEPLLVEQNRRRYGKRNRRRPRPVASGYQAVAAILMCLAGSAAGSTLDRLWENDPEEVLAPAPSFRRASGPYSWETSYARRDKAGGLAWTPRPFTLHVGDSVRHVDFAGGDDMEDGLSPTTAWKHHPWDPRATGRAATGRGVHTYVFKRGVIYRGALAGADSGGPNQSIRLTSDPAWGTGEAVLSGSVQLPNRWQRGADHPDIPDPHQVWWQDLRFAPRCLWLVGGDRTTRVPLARMPNWTASDPEDVKREWWNWDNPGHPYFNLTMTSRDGRRELAMGRDTRHITGPEDLYLGALLWAEFGWVDGTPYPSRVQGFDASKNALGFEGYLGSPTSRVICRYHRYYLEDKPHYLDDPNGEFWFRKRADGGGRLYLRLPNGGDPNVARLEAGRETTILDLTGARHVEVSGLTFRFTNVAWDLAELPWQYGNRFRLKKHLHPACIRVWGGAEDLTIAHCTFEHVNSGLLMKAVTPGESLDRIVVRDCVFRETDHHGVSIEDGLLWGDTQPDRGGHLFDVKILRNAFTRTGLRPPRVGSGNAINLDNPQTLEVAGNVVDRAWHAGINVRGAKISGNLRDCPLSRLLIHQNKVTNAIRTGDDCGNIETWQGGPAYVFNNVSGNPGGYRHSAYELDRGKANPGGARFGMAYYLDGSFKNYVFNNIGWGLSRDIRNRTGATAMFQEIIGFQNTFFNNTAYNFVKGSRRQAPQAGRNMYLGNVWDGIGDWVFWHTTPAKAPTAGNEQDEGAAETDYELETNAYAGNVFHDIEGKMGSFLSSGAWHQTLAEAQQVLRAAGALAADVGVETERPPLRDPANGRFDLAVDSAAVDRGAKVFVPWATYANVGEWNFYPAGRDAVRIPDEHWSMPPYYYVRDTYHRNPRFPLTGVNISRRDFVPGPLENWISGACSFNGTDQYAYCPNTILNQTLRVPITYKWDRNGQQETLDVSGKAFRSPQVHDTSFLVEAYFRTEPGHTRGILVRKCHDSGYTLAVNPSGGITFRVGGDPGSRHVRSAFAINDGRWHHVLAECDRDQGRLILNIDGRRDTIAPGIGADVSLANEADLYVGGTPQGGFLHGTLEFLRISLGTLKDAKTTIDELYAWQFDGPFLYDFAGNPPQGKRDAGALERIP